MSITLTKPIYHKGAVLQPGTKLDTSEAHGRELLRKGYATQPQTSAKGDSSPPPKSDPPPKPKGKGGKKAGQTDS